MFARLSLSLAALLAAGHALAGDFQTTAPIRAVTVYPQGAQLTREITLELPAGTHRVLLPAPGADLWHSPPRVRAGEGTAIGALTLLGGHVADAETVYLPQQAAALAALEAAEDALDDARDRQAAKQAELAAAEARLTFLSSVSGGALENLAPEALSQTAAMIGQETARARTEIAALRPALRALAEEIEDLEGARAQARRDLDALSPPEGPVDMLAIAVEQVAAGTATLEIREFVQDAGWAPAYDLRLTRGAAPGLELARKVVLAQETGEPWLDVDLALSTADPFAQIEPTDPYPNRAVIRPKGQLLRGAPEKMAGDAMEAAPAMAEPAPIVAAGTLAADGITVTYSYPRKVSIPALGDGLILELDRFALDPEVTLRATPRHDDTAFIMAEFTNTTGEPLLPGSAALYRDGTYVGAADLDMIPAGGDETVSFGAMEGIRLDWRALRTDTGDTGIVARKNAREEALEFSVENLTGKAEEVLTLFALPFSEQEDLKIRTTTRPEPDETDYDKDRGVGAWRLTLAPGEKRTVRVDVALNWPDDQELYWQP
ncbi:DUF4139 domain-containing protein [Actibacterium sp. MT2.3-13A]|uniref:DUF4139 domain-containing protein n=1 Tax=Actibacterium sp. MT2.3-13A TaxID=2828332 RepID=UPI001BADF76F|nr:DUF4139 domain-containing protein [Actibacterium sp. MT2.3-13A]